jgi:hypothetical protein
MSDQFLDLILVAGITILITLLWAASIAYTYWDTHNVRPASRSPSFWMALVVLLPFVGFTAYILYRTALQFFSARTARKDLPLKRETPLKRPAGRRSPLPTFMAADLEMQTIADPRRALGADVERGRLPMQYVFMVSSGAERGREFIVEHLPAKIGRGSEASIRLDRDLGVSRNQAELYAQGTFLRIRDLHSTHGTFVNGFRINDTLLGPGDVIKIGMTELVLEDFEG